MTPTSIEKARQTTPDLTQPGPDVFRKAPPNFSTRGVTKCGHASVLNT
jgi:hypothetical protein